MGRKHCSLLPTRQVAQVLTRKVDDTIWSIENLIFQTACLQRPIGPGTLTVGDLVPANRDAARHLRAIVMMDFFTAHDGRLKSMLGHQLTEPLADQISPDIGAEQDTLLLVKASGGIPDLRDVAIGPGDATVDLQILFPKTTIRLKCDLCGLDIVAGGDG